MTVDQTLNNIRQWQQRWKDLGREALQDQWIEEMRSVQASLNLTATQTTALLRTIADVTGFTVGDLRRDVHNNINNEAAAGPTTHDDWARQWLRGRQQLIAAAYDKFWVCNEQTLVWEPIEKDSVTVEIGEMRGINCRRYNDYTSIVRHAYAIANRQSAFDNAPHGLAIQDKFYYWGEKGVTVEPLSANHYCRFRIDAELLNADEAPYFKRYLDATFPAADEGADENRLLFAQHLAVILFGLGNQLQKALLWIGPTASGKTTAQKIISNLLPDYCVTSCPPERWRNQYAIASFASALVNLAGEVDYKKALGAEFLAITGNEAYLTGRQPYGREFSFKPRTTHIFNSNEFLRTTISSAAFFRRWSTLLFPNTVPEEQREANMSEKVEPGAVLQFALSSANTLLNDGVLGITATQRHNDVMRQWQLEANTCVAFFHDEEYIKVTGDPEHFVGRQPLYDAYRRWCEDEGRHPVSRTEFVKFLRRNSGQSLDENPRRTVLKDVPGYFTSGRKGNMRVWLGLVLTGIV